MRRIPAVVVMLPLALSACASPTQSLPATATEVLLSPSTVVAITAITPTAGPTGTIVTVRGSGFAVDSVVRFGNQEIREVGFTDGTLLRFAVPTGPQIGPGSYEVAVVAVGHASNRANFRVEAGSAQAAGGITITGLSPDSGPVGTIVTIRGSGFASAGNAVRFGSGWIKDLNSPDGASVTFTVPEGLDVCAPGAVGPCPAILPRVMPGDYAVKVVAQGATSNEAPFLVK